MHPDLLPDVDQQAACDSCAAQQPLHMHKGAVAAEQLAAACCLGAELAVTHGAFCLQSIAQAHHHTAAAQAVVSSRPGGHAPDVVVLGALQAVGLGDDANGALALGVSLHRKLQDVQASGISAGRACAWSKTA